MVRCRPTVSSHVSRGGVGRAARGEGGGEMRSTRLTLGLAVAAAILLSGQPALAGRDWCAGDPILTFQDGTRVQWETRLETVNLASASGASFWVEVPGNIGPVTVSFPAAPLRETVTISYTGPAHDGKGAFGVHATVTVDASTTFDTFTTIRGNVAKATDVAGTANAATKVNAKVDARQWYDLVRTTAVVSSATVSATTTVTSR